MAKAYGRGLTAAQRRRVARIQASLKRIAEDDGMSEEALDEKLDAIEDVVDEADDELKKDDKGDMEKEEGCGKKKRDATRRAALRRARAARRRRASEVGDTAKEQFEEVDVVTDADGEPKVTSEEELRVDAARRRARAARRRTADMHWQGDTLIVNGEEAAIITGDDDGYGYTVEVNTGDDDHWEVIEGLPSFAEAKEEAEMTVKSASKDIPKRHAKTTDVTGDPENEIVLDENFDELQDEGIMKEDTKESRRRAARYLVSAKAAAGQLPVNTDRKATVARLASRYTTEQLRIAARKVNKAARTAKRDSQSQVRVSKRPSGLSRSTRTARRSNGNDEFLFY